MTGVDGVMEQETLALWFHVSSLLDNRVVYEALAEGLVAD